MNIGVLLPVRKKWWKPVTLKTYPIEIDDSLNLVVCLLTVNENEVLRLPGINKRFKAKLDRILEDQKIWPILGHPFFNGLYQADTSVYGKAVKALALQLFHEILNAIKGLGTLINKEILVTGSSEYLEHAIEILITKVKTINILIPKGVNEPVEAERAFLETGIPVHITTDCDVVNRTGIWIKFPGDNFCFDALSRNIKGIILDLDSMKIIDTKTRKIFNICVEFSDKVKRMLGQQLLNTWEKNVLEGFILTVCAKTWNMSESEVFKRLGMRFSLFLDIAKTVNYNVS
ncbi:MAG: hypothetical protein GX022_00435 [Clostridiaceae bacterium]|nr:hypothetical protein [Clostridiaceae bacterium]